ncbi:MAG: XRE family transcriptional regulator [Alphaproteobacteria bacterium]|nr:XRE family transcriptional regulator [Alphaproteobacteria bacterium]
MTSEFNGGMLRIARQFRGLHQKELAELAGVDAAILSRAENNALVPSDHVLDKCAKQLAVPRQFFFEQFHPTGLPLSFHHMWRKRQSVAQRDVDRVLAHANIRAFHLRRLLQSVVIEPTLPLPQFEPGEYGNDCREIAKLVRRSWAAPAGPLLNLTSYVERAGIFVAHVDLEKVDVDGLTVRMPGLPPCILLNRFLPADRMRFTLAHELAHVVMHRVPSSEMEKQANDFASALLLPSDDLRPYLIGRKIDLKLLAQLKPQWRVSMASLLMASRELDLLGPGQEQRLWKIFSAKKYRMREPTELDFAVEQTTLDRRLIDAHLKELDYSLEELGELLVFEVADICEVYQIPTPRRGLRVVS